MARTEEERAVYTFPCMPDPFSVKCEGVRANIIDFTLSRLTISTPSTYHLGSLSLRSFQCSRCQYYHAIHFVWFYWPRVFNLSNCRYVEAFSVTEIAEDCFTFRNFSSLRYFRRNSTYSNHDAVGSHWPLIYISARSSLRKNLLGTVRCQLNRGTQLHTISILPVV